MKAIWSLSFVLCLLSSAFAEEWGFAFTGQILETANGTKAPAVYRGETNYEANVYIRIYDESEGEVSEKAKALWGRRIVVHTKNAMFSCELKDSAGAELTAQYSKLQDAFANLKGDRVMVGVTPFDDGRAEITPRQTLIAAPVAVSAGDALGTVGDVTVGKTLTVGSGKAPSADFKGPVSHDADVTFGLSPILPALTLGDSATLTAQTLAATGTVSVESVEATAVTARNAKVSVKSLGDASFENLSVSGTAELGAVKAADENLVLTGTVKAQSVKATKFVLGGSFDFFKWGPVTEIVEGGKEGDVSRYIGKESQGYWVVPSTEQGMEGDVFVSLSCAVKFGTEEATVDVTDTDGTSMTIAKLAYTSTGSSDDECWMPVQVFLLRGQKISWSGLSHLTFKYRRFTY